MCSVCRVRAVMLDTALQPYTDIADLYIIDPDGFIIRWVSPSSGFQGCFGHLVNFDNQEMELQAAQ